MRSAVVVAAFAANVLAVPFVAKRDEVVVTDINVVYQTDVVTVQATEIETTTAETPAPANTWGHWGHSWGGQHSSHKETPTTPSSTYVAPVATSTYVPPPPPPPPSSTYVAPPPPAAPTTTQAPAAPNTWPAAPSGGVTPTGTTDYPKISWTSSAAYTGYSEVAVLHHNFHRHNHSAPLLTWNDTLAKSAQDLANTCHYGHNTDMDGGGYGQNIAAGVEMGNISSVITDLFYNGEVNAFNGLYGQAQPSMSNFEAWGHFSQIVWAETTSFACATSNCTARGLGGVGDSTPAYFTVCNYFPAGNFANEYGKNIGKPVDVPSAQWDSC